MKKESKFYLAIMALVLLNLLLLNRLYSSNRYISELQQGMTVINDNQLMVRGKKDKLVANIELSFVDWGKKVNNFDSVLSLRQRPLLVLRIHEKNCNDCINQSLIHLNNLIAQEDSIPFDVIVSTSYSSLDLLRQDFNLKLLPIQYDHTIDLELDYTSQPYIFLVDREGIVSNPFVPEYDIMELFIAYLKSIVR